MHADPPDGTGIPVVESETEGRTGKSEDRSATPREARIGCVFAGARHRSLGRTQKAVVLSDGAEWIANIAADHFPGSVHTLDTDYLRESLGI